MQRFVEVPELEVLLEPIGWRLLTLFVRAATCCVVLVRLDNLVQYCRDVVRLCVARMLLIAAQSTERWRSCAPFLR